MPICTCSGSKPDQLTFLVMVLLHSHMQIYAGEHVWHLNCGNAAAVAAAAAGKVAAVGKVAATQ